MSGSSDGERPRAVDADGGTTAEGGDHAMDGATDTVAPDSEGEDEGHTYGGLFGAFPYAFGASESRLFKSYVAIGGLLALLIAFAFVLSVIRVIGATGGSATLDFSRVFVALIGLLVVFPIVAPVLLVARRHRRATGTGVTYDRRLAATGYLFLMSLYVGVIPTVPPEYQTESNAVVEGLYGLPMAVGLAFPISIVVVMFLVHRRSK